MRGIRGCAAIAALGALLAGGACRQAGDPPAPVAPTAPTPAPPAGSQAPALTLPVAPGDSGRSAYGIWPFGVHGGGHAFDGHPGWDVEVIPGRSVRVAADGVVTTVMPDPNSPDAFTVQIEHGNRRYRTNYTNLTSLAPGIAVGASVRAGQALGVPTTITLFMGPRIVTFAATHFQFDDLEQNIGQTNGFAANPADYLGPAGLAEFDAVWRTAAYSGELTEPFPGNPREVAFPLTRTWTRESGVLAARIDFTRQTPSTNTYHYVLYDDTGAVIERGTAEVDPGAVPAATIDLTSEAGGLRRGVWDVVSGRMELDYAAAGAARPASLGGASVYSTR